MGAPALSVHDLGCDRGGRAVVRGVSFSLRSGEALQLFGRNGSGKSSILECLAGIRPPASGTIRWKDGATVPATYLAHAHGMKTTLSVDENLTFWATVYGRDRQQTARAIDRLGMAQAENQRFGHLSAGQKMRTSLARCVLSGRPVWLLDEPTAALDTEGQILVKKILQEHLATGGIAIIATHQVLDLPSWSIELTS